MNETANRMMMITTRHSLRRLSASETDMEFYSSRWLIAYCGCRADTMSENAAQTRIKFTSLRVKLQTLVDIEIIFWSFTEKKYPAENFSKAISAATPKHYKLLLCEKPILKGIGLQPLVATLAAQSSNYSHA
jgi:hypothetical protein